MEKRKLSAIPRPIATKNETPAVKNKPQENKRKGIPPQERVRNAVRATGNKWAIENFNATH